MLGSNFFVWVRGSDPPQNQLCRLEEESRFPFVFNKEGRPDSYLLQPVEFGTGLAFYKSTCDGRPEQELPSDPKEHDNEGKDERKASSQNRSSNRGDGWYLHGSDRSAGSRRGRRAAHSLPPQTSKLLDDLADPAQLTNQDHQAS